MLTTPPTCVRGFFSSYHFTGLPEFRRALYLAAGAVIAAFGAWWQWRLVPVR